MPDTYRSVRNTRRWRRTALRQRPHDEDDVRRSFYAMLAAIVGIAGSLLGVILYHYW